jgi:hypothetical protein
VKGKRLSADCELLHPNSRPSLDERVL